MKSFAIVLLLVFSSKVFAVKDTKELTTPAQRGAEGEVERLKAELAASEERLAKEALKQTKILEEEGNLIIETQAKVDKDRVDSDSMLGGGGLTKNSADWYTGKGTGILKAQEEAEAGQKKVDASRESLKQKRGDMDKAYEAIEKNKKDYQDKIGQAQATIESERTAMSDMKTQIGYLYAAQKFDTAMFRVDDVGLRIKALERAIDAAAVGEYVRIKMAKMMSSPLYCKTINECVAGKEPKVDRKEIDDPKNKIFTTKSENSGRKAAPVSPTQNGVH